MDSTLQSIRELESQTEAKIEEARRKKDILIAEAKNKSILEINTSQEPPMQGFKDDLEKQKKKIDKANSEILKKGEMQLASFEEKGRRNMDKAVDLIVASFEEML